MTEAERSKAYRLGYEVGAIYHSIKKIFKIIFGE